MPPPRLFAGEPRGGGGGAGADPGVVPVRRLAAVRARRSRSRRSGCWPRRGCGSAPAGPAPGASCTPSGWSRTSRWRRRSRSAADGSGLPGAEVFDPFTGSRLEVSGPLSPLQGGRSASVRVVTRFPRRGLHTLAPPSLLRPGPARARPRRGHQRRARRSSCWCCRVPSRCGGWSPTARAGGLSCPKATATAEALAAVDLDGLRPYRPGTPASRISLAGGGPRGRADRAPAAGRRRQPAAGRARRARRVRPRELLDAAVRAAASLTLEFARGGGCGLLLPGEQRATPIDRELVTWPAAYARLALVRGRARIARRRRWAWRPAGSAR